ncbi:antitoxin CptB [Sulfitobacter undariae]|uniref:FAD assembly factor SdhE n=2 Tax=Sulfitobacter undariae TaxID=1563671 RepID=A0A7W6E4Z9_9RHOB|nr:antitoxin CptB [Sulfitobacter undariae]
MIEIPQPERPENEPRDVRVKRLTMRSMRRGIKEMDLILSAYAGDRLEGMDEADLDLYDDMLNENDHDIYQWITGFLTPKPVYEAMVEDIQAHISKG